VLKTRRTGHDDEVNSKDGEDESGGSGSWFGDGEKKPLPLPPPPARWSASWMRFGRECDELMLRWMLLQYDDGSDDEE
jgi:hypothetical protein